MSKSETMPAIPKSAVFQSECLPRSSFGFVSSFVLWISSFPSGAVPLIVGMGKAAELAQKLLSACWKWRLWFISPKRQRYGDEG
jgi:hypothetical protein